MVGLAEKVRPGQKLLDGGRIDRVEVWVLSSSGRGGRLCKRPPWSMPDLFEKGYGDQHGWSKGMREGWELRSRLDHVGPWEPW